MAVAFDNEPSRVLPGTVSGDTSADLGGALGTAAGILAAASGLIHIAVVPDHREFALVAAGFAAMAAAQWAFALRILTRPSTRVLLLGGALHGALVAVWVLSRTTGLRVISGAETAEEVGIADLVSTTFCLAVVGMVTIARSLDRAGAVRVPRLAARRFTAAMLVGVSFLTIPAVLVPHHHDEHATDVHAPDDQHHGSGSVVTIGGHGHGTGSTGP